MLLLALSVAALFIFTVGFAVPLIALHRFLRVAFCLEWSVQQRGKPSVGLRLGEADELLDICLLDP